MEGEELGSSKVTQRFQVTIPDQARSELGLKGGDYVVFIKDEQSRRIYLRAAKLVYK